MGTPAVHHQIEIIDGDRAVAFAKIDVPTDCNEPAQVVFRAESGHIPTGSRARLVDAVLDLPEVQDNGRLTATVPFGDAESVHRLQERAGGMTMTSAGATVLVEVQLAPPNAKGRDV